jgi:hypothetical protein
MRREISSEKLRIGEIYDVDNFGNSYGFLAAWIGGR